jgi:hypothetical protein
MLFEPRMLKCRIGIDNKNVQIVNVYCNNQSNRGLKYICHMEMVITTDAASGSLKLK